MNKGRSETLRRLSTPERSLSFAFKMGLAMSILSVVCAILLAFFVIQQYRTHSLQQQYALSETIVRQLAAGMVDPVFTEDELAMQLHLNQLVENSSVRTAAIVSESGVELAIASRSTRRLKELQKWIKLRLNGSTFNPQKVEGAAEETILFEQIALNGIVGAYAVIYIDDNAQGFSLANASRALVLALVAITLFALIAAFIISRLLARPVYRLLAVSEAARSGRVDLIDKLESKSPLANEWGDILKIYSELGKEVKSNQALEAMLQRFVASDVADHLLSGSQRLTLEGARVEATVLFVDIVDFTQTAESMSPEDVAAMLNRYLEIFASCARLHKGTVDKFIGDAAMVVFGAPREDAKHRENALACAHAIQEVARQINTKRSRIGLKPIHLRVGVNSGQMYAGILGSEHRMEFTVVGDAVNLAARLCDSAAPGEILLSSNVYNDEMQHTVKVETQGQLMIKGKKDAVSTFRLLDAKTEKQWVVRGLIEDLVAIGDRGEKSYE